jgi:hypothetical protein
MSSLIGIRVAARVTADVVVTASTSLVTTGLTVPIAANQIFKVRIWLPFSVGATGGVKMQIVLPAAPTSILTSIVLFDPVTPQIITAVQTSSTAFANALAVAGTHWMIIDSIIYNGVNAGNVDVQVACNSAANALTALKGGWMDVVKAN